MSIFPRCLLLIAILSFTIGCSSGSGSPSNQKVLNKSKIPASDKNIIESTSQAQDPQTQKLYNELDKELDDLRGVLDNMETIDDKDLEK